MTGGFYATLDNTTVKPYLPAVPVMLPSASWWNDDINLMKRAPSVPRHVPAVAIDTGSYTLAQKFADGYPYGFMPASIVNWITRVHLTGAPVTWAVLPDWPCEGKTSEEVRVIQQRGTATALYMFSHYYTQPWVWCPVVQGQTVEDYLRHAIDLSEMVWAATEFYRRRGQSEHFRVCIGSICRRGETPLIREVVEALAAVLPGTPLHLFGVKLSVLVDWPGRPASVYSTDSAAFNRRFGRDLEVARQQQAELGLKQREYTLGVLLPRYAEAVNRALLAPTTGGLFDDIYEGP